MPKFTDLIGQRFGRLTVQHLSDRTYISPGGQVHNQWVCICDCGNILTRRVGELRKSKVPSCGCYKKELMRNNSKRWVGKPSHKRINLEGKRFGKLKVISCMGYDSKTKKIMWDCLCDCGKHSKVSTNNLVKKNRGITSCGCIKAESLRNKYFIDLSGKRYGMLTVNRRVGDYVSPKGQPIAKWECTCDCGNIIETTRANLNRGHILSCGCIKESYVAHGLKKYFKKYYQAIIEFREFRNPKTNSFLPYDIFIPSSRAYIEIQGIQHYRDGWWNKLRGFNYRKNIDKIKKQYAESNGTYIEIDLRKIKTVEEAICYIEKRI